MPIRVFLWVLRHFLDSAIYRLGLVRDRIARSIPLPLTFDWSVDYDDVPFLVDRQGQKIFVSSPERFSLYRRGVGVRLHKLASEYGIESLLAARELNFVDVGANIGELGMYFSFEGNGNYIAFEPDPVAFAALRKNVKGQTLRQVALGEKKRTQRLFLATSRADSGLHRPPHVEGEIEVDVVTLDDEIQYLGLDRIHVLKVEAEGSEPEVLEGARKSLRMVDVCVVDAGPEREGASTAPQCLEILQSEGFKLVDVRFPRGILVFEKNST